MWECDSSPAAPAREKANAAKMASRVIDQGKSSDYQYRNDPSVVEMNHCCLLMSELSGSHDSHAYANQKHAGPAHAVDVFLQNIFCSQRAHHITQR